MFKGKKILVTGATGFIGANLVRRLHQENAKVHICIRHTSDCWRINDILSQFKVHHLDLLKPLSVRRVVNLIKPQIVIHNAIYGGYIFQRSGVKAIKTNFLGTVNLLNACRKVKLKLFINTGSSSEYGIKSRPMKEDDFLEPVNDYGVSKAAATLYCQARAKNSDFPISTLRLFSPYGYYEAAKRLIPSVVLACLKGESPKVSSPKPVRDFIFIEDVVNAYLKTIQNVQKVNGEVFNIGFGRQHHVGEVVETIIRLTGRKVKPLWGEVSNPRQEPDKWEADIRKANRILGWVPKIGLEEGLKTTVDWFKAIQNLYV